MNIEKVTAFQESLIGLISSILPLVVTRKIVACEITTAWPMWSLEEFDPVPETEVQLNWSGLH